MGNNIKGSTKVSEQDLTSQYDPFPQGSLQDDKLWNNLMSSYDTILDLLGKSMEKINLLERRIQTQEELQEKIEEDNKKNEKTLSFQDSIIKDQEKEIKRQKRLIADQGKTNLELFGIFASIFTFISVEITILAKAEGIYQLLGLTLILIGSVLLILSLIFIFSEQLLQTSRITKNQKKLYSIFGTIIIACLALGIIFSSIGNENITINIGKGDKEKIVNLQDQIDNLQLEFNKLKKND